MGKRPWAGVADSLSDAERHQIATRADVQQAVGQSGRQLRRRRLRGVRARPGRRKQTDVELGFCLAASGPTRMATEVTGEVTTEVTGDVAGERLCAKSP